VPRIIDRRWVEPRCVQWRERSGARPWINCFSHDTVACLLDDGRLVALAEEERFNRQRHTKRFPDQAIGFCLGLAGIGIRGGRGRLRPPARARPGQGVADALTATASNPIAGALTKG
jgi:hypothetical protein